MDTKYFQRALDEFNSRDQVLPGSERKLAPRRIGDLDVSEFSEILRRAQELKDADQRKSAVLDRMGA